MQMKSDVVTRQFESADVPYLCESKWVRLSRSYAETNILHYHLFIRASSVFGRQSLHKNAEGVIRRKV